MDRNEKDEKFLEILQNEQFQQEAQNVQTVEDLQGLLAKHGLEMSMEEFNEFREEVAACMQQGELNEEALEGVAGGKARKTTKKTVRVAAAVLTGGLSEVILTGYRYGYNNTSKKRK